MLISTPNLSNGNKEFALTPTMIRGAFLLWRSELQRGQQLAEIRDIDRLPPRAPGHLPVVDSQECSPNSTGGGDALPNPLKR